ncbi:MAG: nuclear transport factor 2 family protein [Saprospiraceae bacterium]
MKTLIITGNESLFDKENETVALINFYKAFNNRDLDLMKNVWLNSAEASMNNPLGGIMRGWAEIENVYDKIFNGKVKVYVEFYDFTIHKTEDMFFATGRERGYFKTDKIEIQLAIRTSRIFKHIDCEWKQIQHHGSIDNPDVLKKYQKLLSK